MTGTERVLFGLNSPYGSVLLRGVEHRSPIRR